MHNCSCLALLSAASAGVAGTVVEQDLKLIPDESIALASTGFSVGVSGAVAIVGAPFVFNNGGEAGVVYLFDAESGNQIQKVAPDDPMGGDRFGWSLAMEGATLVVGAPFRDGPTGNSNWGAAYVFDSEAWLQTGLLVAEDAGPQDWLGSDVAVSGDLVVLGAPNKGSGGVNVGAAYVFNASTMTQIAKLVPADGAHGDNFGLRVAIDGTTVIVGAMLHDAAGTDSGAAYVFDALTGEQLKKLVPNDADSFDRFGSGVAISGSTVLVGAPWDEELGVFSGSAYLFDASSGIQVAKYLASDGTVEDEFGYDVTLDGVSAVIGARGAGGSGAAYHFDTESGTQVAKLVPSDGSRSDALGSSVALSGGVAVVGAPMHDGNGNEAGAAYLYALQIGCDADANRDGVVDSLDLNSVLVDFGCLDTPCAGDVNGDGFTDISDLEAVLGAFGAACP